MRVLVFICSSVSLGAAAHEGRAWGGIAVSVYGWLWWCGGKSVSMYDLAE